MNAPTQGDSSPHRPPALAISAAGHVYHRRDLRGGCYSRSASGPLWADRSLPARVAAGPSCDEFLFGADHRGLVSLHACGGPRRVCGTGEPDADVGASGVPDRVGDWVIHPRISSGRGWLNHRVCRIEVLRRFIEASLNCKRRSRRCQRRALTASWARVPLEELPEDIIRGDVLR